MTKLFTEFPALIYRVYIYIICDFNIYIDLPRCTQLIDMCLGVINAFLIEII
jgi:hypothetical protein